MPITRHGAILARVFPLLLLAGLTACGGGGGGIVSAPEKKQVMDLSQVNLVCDVQPGQACDGAQATVTLYADVRDQRPLATEKPANGGAPVFKAAQREKQSDGSWLVKFALLDGLPEGTYSGTMEFAIGDISLLTYDYLPRNVSYTVKVAGLKGKLSALVRLAGASDWEGYQGNASHNALVAVTLDAASFSRRWTWIAPAVTLSAAVSANGLVYFNQVAQTPGTESAVPSKYDSILTALSENDAAPQWTQSRFAQSMTSAPAVSGKRLVLLDTQTVYAFDALSGARLAEVKQPNTNGLLAAPSVEVAPTLSGGNVYAIGANDVIAADGLTGASLWSTTLNLPRLSTLAESTPALGQTMAWTNVNGEFAGYRLADGVKQWSLAVPGPGGGTGPSLLKFDVNQAPVLLENNTALLLNRRDLNNPAQDNTLSAIDLAGHALRWSVDGKFATLPVGAGGVVYVGNHATSQLEARRLGDGAVLWSWPLPAGDQRFTGSVVLTNNLLFIATAGKTYAIDVASHKTVWSYHLSGPLLMSANGVLYISTRNAATSSKSWLTAINLQ